MYQNDSCILYYFLKTKFSAKVFQVLGKKLEYFDWDYIEFLDKSETSGKFTILRFSPNKNGKENMFI
jgi:nicotinic acid phosphoribosyltransferase